MNPKSTKCVPCGDCVKDNSGPKDILIRCTDTTQCDATIEECPISPKLVGRDGDKYTTDGTEKIDKLDKDGKPVVVDGKTE